MAYFQSKPVAGRHFLQIPGPTNVPDRVLRALDNPTMDHRGPDFGKLGAQIPGFEVTTSLRLGAFPYGKAESIADLDAMERAIAANSAGRPSRGGKGVALPSESCTSWGSSR